MMGLDHEEVALTQTWHLDDEAIGPLLQVMHLGKRRICKSSDCLYRAWQQVLSEFNIQPLHGGACTGTEGWNIPQDRPAFAAVNPAEGSVTASAETLAGGEPQVAMLGSRRFCKVVAIAKFATLQLCSHTY
ncbi:hypothetical protein, partial [Variovorax sp. E3]|uniref:hypothetical protein n=1 Tax=Variovorax sp. E3 TaxID=1914993 RepID=UPI0018DDE0EF